MAVAPNKGKGRGIAFLRAHVDYDAAECLIWPMSRNPNGYAMFGFEGRCYWAHRFMCELANGPAPSPQHEVAHTCGRGKDGCVHPKHLAWKTKTENGLDRRSHGTAATNPNGMTGKLMPDQVARIRELEGQKTQAEIAAMFGISEPSVRDIFLGRTHRADRKIHIFTAAEDAILIAAQPGELGVIAAQMGLTIGSVSARHYRLRKRSHGQQEPEKSPGR